jgi:hypothetical protein
VMRISFIYHTLSPIVARTLVIVFLRLFVLFANFGLIRKSAKVLAYMYIGSTI